MQQLNARLVKTDPALAKEVAQVDVGKLPEKVLQFGEGNFLRGFVDWMIDRMNRKGLFNGRVVVAQPISRGMATTLNEQDGLYTLLLHGIQDGKAVEEKSVVSCISRCLNLYAQFDEYIKLASSPDLRFVVSNTTEAGIAYSPDDRYDDCPPSSYPGKLTVFLHKRYEAFNGAPDKGLIVIPCELIEENGKNLRKIVLRLAEEWKLGDGFTGWVKNSCKFMSTLVDRIVTGYPRDEAEKYAGQLGYEDKLLDTAEIFHLWVIEGDKSVAREFPAAEAGLHVIWTDDMTPYRTRKVRILNGAHTMTVLAAYQMGFDTVRECVEDKVVGGFMRKAIFEDIIPILDLPKEELDFFANAVLDRFDNPYIRHMLMSIALNSTSKFKVRVLPTILDNIRRHNRIPEKLAFAFASYITFYRGTELRGGKLVGSRRKDGEYLIADDAYALEKFAALWKAYDGTRAGAGRLVSALFADKKLWDEDLNRYEGLAGKVADYVFRNLNEGVDAVMRSTL